MFDENGPYLLLNTILQKSYFWNMKTYTIHTNFLFILCYFFSNRLHIYPLAHRAVRLVHKYNFYIQKTMKH